MRLLAATAIALFVASSAYDRDDWPHWVDADRDCQDTRQEVLIEESLVPVQLDDTGCKVLSGRWRCPWTGRESSDPRDFDVDHTVPLREAHERVGDEWSKDRKREFANDLAHPEALNAMWAAANRSKGARGPDEWGVQSTA
jgi:hypothetical protein